MTSKRLVLFGGGIAIAVVITALFVYANINYAQEGTVKVVTKWGGIERVYTPADGWFTTLAPGREAYTATGLVMLVDVQTATAPSSAFSKDQLVLNKQLYQLLFASGNGLTLGESMIRAKAAVTDGDIRRTWLLLGDPTMRLK